jgi:16S rRNA (guanine1207-N2)-methyltransferase
LLLEPRTVPEPRATGYRIWQIAPLHAGGVAVRIASKPGVLAHGDRDVAAMMLAEAVASRRPENGPMASVHLHCGNGLVPAMAVARGFDVTALDRHVANTEATRRSLAASAAASGSSGADTPPDTGATRHTVHHAVLPTMVASASAGLVTVRIPTDKVGVRQAIAEAYRCLAVGGTCLLAGATDEGVKPAARLLEELFGMVRIDAQHSGHRLLSTTKRHDAPIPAAICEPEWLDPASMRRLPVALAGESFTLCTRPGVFSWEHLDEATELLATHMRVHTGESVLDIGCGAGALGVIAARASQGGRVLLLDADADAVRCARESCALAGVSNAEVRASDIAEAAGDERFDVVVTNPPFHLGKRTDLTVPDAFIAESHAQLAPGGRLYLVANRTLPYEQLIAARFGAVQTVHDGRRFKVLSATRTA